MGVRVDAAGDDELAGGVDGAGAAGDPIQVLAHRLYHPEIVKEMETFETLFTHFDFYPGQRRSRKRGRVNHRRRWPKVGNR